MQNMTWLACGRSVFGVLRAGFSFLLPFPPVRSSLKFPSYCWWSFARLGWCCTSNWCMERKKRHLASYSSETVTLLSFEREMITFRELLIYLRNKPINVADILVTIVWLLSVLSQSRHTRCISVPETDTAKVGVWGVLGISLNQCLMWGGALTSSVFT